MNFEYFCSVKVLLLDSIGKEAENQVHLAVLQLIGTIAFHELAGEQNQWPELLAAIQTSTQSEKAEERQVGIMKAPVNTGGVGGVIQGVFFSSTNTNITITLKVIRIVFIGLKHFKEETHCYEMVKTA